MSATYTPVAVAPESARYSGWGEWISGQRDAASKAGMINQTLEDFTKKYSYAVGEDGKFKGPAAGIAYDAEGMTPEEYYNAKIGPQYTNTGWDGDTTLTGFNQSVNADWRPGPDNSGGFLGGLGRAVKGMVNGVAKIPPLRMAADAVTGGAAEWVFAANAIDNGGDPMDVAKQMAMSYIGGRVGAGINGAVGGGTLGSMAGSAGKALITGKNPLMAAAMSGFGGGASNPAAQMAVSAMFSNGQQKSTPIKGSNFASLTAQYNPETVASLIEASKRKSPSMNSDWFVGGA
jgi:hypothetical protein